MEITRSAALKKETKPTGEMNTEVRHQQIYKNLLVEFRKCEESVRLKFEMQKKDKEVETAKQSVETVKRPEIKEPDQKEIIKLRHLLRKKEYELSYGDRQFITLMTEKHPDLSLKKESKAFYSVNMYKIEKPDKKQTPVNNDQSEENLPQEANEKEQLFETIVKEFRAKYDKEYKKQLEKLSDPFFFESRTSDPMEKTDWEVLQECYRVLGNEYMKKHDVKESLKFFQAFKMLCDKNKTYTLKMFAYKEIGFCYKLVKQYRSALINFKKLLQLAWYRKHKGWELKSYDYIGIAYYYLGELEKSRYYHRRMWQGIYESETSTVRILSVNALNQKMESRISIDDRGLPQIKLDSSYIINQSDEEENDLPSPRTGSGEENQKLLPFYSQKKIANKASFPYINTNPHGSQTSRKNTNIQSLGNRIHPFTLISHLSPNESPNNYFYVEQMSSFRVRSDFQKLH